MSEDSTVHQALSSPFLNTIIEKIGTSSYIQTVSMVVFASKLGNAYKKVSHSEKRGNKDSKGNS